jgi:hypothetical protein
MILAKIKEILEKKLNESIADSIIRVNCERMGIEPEKLDSSRLNEFAEKIKFSMLLFLSDPEAQDMVGQIKMIKEKNDTQA